MRSGTRNKNKKKNQKKKILISAGPTIEDFDPVRFLSNRSTGKMGYALARAAIRAGHEVILVSGPVHLKQPRDCQFVSVRSARDMHKAMLKHFLKADVIVMAAAVCDYRPAKTSVKKIKKTNAPMTLKLIRNPDILKTMGTKKQTHQKLIGFAAETHQLKKNAQEKLKSKKLDWIIANQINKAGIGFASSDNEVTLYHHSGEFHKFSKQSKTSLANKIWRLVLQ